MAEMTMEQVVRAVAKELNLENLTDATIAQQINRAIADVEAKLTSVIEEERKLRNAAEEGVAELRARLQRRESFDRDYGFHRGVDGTVKPNISRECGEHLIGVFREAFGRGHNRVFSAGTDSEGGYLVAPEYASELMRLLPTVGLFPRIARTVPMSSDEKNFGTLLSSFTAYWPAENVAITPSYAGFGQLKLSAKILAAYSVAPEGLLDDATPEMGNLIGDLIVETLAAELDRVGIYGRATGGSDAFDGIAFASGVVAKVMASTETATNKVTPDYLLDLQTTVPDGAREGCMYLLSPTVFDFLRKIKSSATGEYMWTPPNSGAPATIWGKPYELTEKLPALSASAAASTPFVLYGNFKKYAILGTRKDIALKASDVSGDTFAKIQTAFRAHGRFAVGAYGAGIAALKTAAS